MQLRHEFKNHTLVINSNPYGSSKLYEHEIELYKNGSLLRSMLVIVNRNKYFDPFSIYECYELYGWSCIRSEHWEDVIRKLHTEYKKLKRNKYEIQN